jgi:hypothetical protein
MGIFLMSRLHDCKTSGGNLALHPQFQTATCKTFNDRLAEMVVSDKDKSPRAGSRHTGTMRKTAKAHGHDHPVIGAWQERSSVEAGKAAKMKRQKAQTASAKNYKKEGASALKG